MIKIYHNPRCRKSREGLEILEKSGKEFQMIKYLDDTFTEEELSLTIKKLNIAPIDLIRKNEKIWKEEFKGKELSDIQLVKAMTNYPKLIERPIIVNKNKAVIGRPADAILEII